jgi:hypothetical protein
MSQVANQKAVTVTYGIVRDDCVSNLIESKKLMLSDIFFVLSVCGRQCPTHFVKISTFVGQNVGQTGGYGIGIAAKFVLQLNKTSSKQCRICTTERNGPGGI